MEGRLRNLSVDVHDPPEYETPKLTFSALLSTDVVT
jgi:hypothetical protein